MDYEDTLSQNKKYLWKMFQRNMKLDCMKSNLVSLEKSWNEFQIPLS